MWLLFYQPVATAKKRNKRDVSTYWSSFYDANAVTASCHYAIFDSVIASTYLRRVENLGRYQVPVPIWWSPLRSVY